MATKVDAFVYNTLAQWYNEDQAAAGSNQTLPAAPSGQQPPPAGTSTQTVLGVPADWTNPAFVAVSEFTSLYVCPPPSRHGCMILLSRLATPSHCMPLLNWSWVTWQYQVQM